MHVTVIYISIQTHTYSNIGTGAHTSNVHSLKINIPYDF